jgi:hypothetical protein
MDPQQNVNHVTTNVSLVKPLPPTVSLVVKEELLHQLVYARMDNTIMVLLNVNHVTTNAANVKPLLTTVLNVLPTESLSQLVIVHSIKDISKLKEPKNAHPVMSNVQLVTPMINVLFVPMEEKLTAIQIVRVQTVNMKIVPENVSIVQFNVKLVLTRPTTV